MYFLLPQICIKVGWQAAVAIGYHARFVQDDTVGHARHPEGFCQRCLRVHHHLVIDVVFGDETADLPDAFPFIYGYHFQVWIGIQLFEMWYFRPADWTP